MKTKFIAILTLGLLWTGVIFAQDAAPIPHKVTNVTITDLNNKEITLPHWGEKNLMLFYIDPDAHKQNEAFTVELEENHRAQGDNIVGYGILNLKDTGYPNFIVRSMARKRTAKNGALVVSDKDRILSKAWNLGDCNDKFVLMIVTKAGELVFMRKGELTEADKQAFYTAIDLYK